MCWKKTNSLLRYRQKCEAKWNLIKTFKFSHIIFIDCCNYTSMALQNCVLCKNKSISYIRNFYKMSEKIFVTKSFKVIPLPRFYLIECNYMFNGPQD